MPSTKVVELIEQVGELLHDRTHTRWPEADLLRWINAAQKAILLQKPDAYIVNEEFSCEDNVTRQSLPDGGIRLIEIVRNLTSGGSKSAISVVDRDVMDTTVRDWHSEASTNDIENYVFDERDPKHFYLYPPPASGTVIEIVYSKIPKDILISDFSRDTQSITLDDVYAQTILDFVMYRAYEKAADYAGNRSLSLSYYNDFANALGMKMKADRTNSPNARS